MKIEDLQKLLIRVQNREAEFNFAGITSNGIDCIYFMPRDDGSFDIDFEAMGSDQLPYIEMLKKYADAHKLKASMTSYGNRTNDTGSPAPVLHIETNSSIDETAKLGKQIEREVFRNSSDTVYEIVP